MKNIMESLFALQKDLNFNPGRGQRKREEAMETIRKTIPSVVLTHYDRLLAHGKKGVAIVRNGVCTECQSPGLPSARWPIWLMRATFRCAAIAAATFSSRQMNRSFR